MAPGTTVNLCTHWHTQTQSKSTARCTFITAHFVFFCHPSRRISSMRTSFHRSSFFVLVNVDSALSRCSWEAGLLHTSTLKLVLPPRFTLRSWHYCLFRCRKHLPEFVCKWMNIHFVLGKLVQFSLREMNNAEIFLNVCANAQCLFLCFFSRRRLSRNMFAEMLSGQSNSDNPASPDQGGFIIFIHTCSSINL